MSLDYFKEEWEKEDKHVEKCKTILKGNKKGMCK